MDHVTAIVSKHGVTEAQALHGDVGHLARHVEVHIPLQDVSLAMGPTLFCPCTQQDSTNTTPTASVVQKVFALGAKCEEFENTHYRAVSQLGDVTLYDASVRHKGLANTADVDRPVLVLAFASSLRQADERNYHDNLMGRLPVAGREMFKFRTTNSLSSKEL